MSTPIWNFHPTTETFARESRDQRAFPETDPPYTTLGEIVVMGVCVLAAIVLVVIVAIEYFQNGGVSPL